MLKNNIKFKKTIIMEAMKSMKYKVYHGLRNQIKYI